MIRGSFSILLAVSVLLAASPAAAIGLSCGRVHELQEAYLNKHYSFRYLNDVLRQRTIDSYIKRLDPSKSMFLTEEKKKLASELR